MNTTGAMGIVLPHGVLFRGASEGEIRKILVDKNCIDAIIGLPEKMFTNTDIPVLVMILKKIETVMIQLSLLMHQRKV